MYDRDRKVGRFLWLLITVVAAVVVILWATGAFAQEVVVDPRDELQRQLNPLINQVILALVGLAATAALGFISWASAAIRGWMKTRDLLGRRKILDEAFANAANRLGNAILNMNQQAVAEYFAEYVQQGIPDTLNKLGAGDLEIRAMTEAAKYIRWAAQQEEWHKSGGGVPGPLVSGVSVVDDPTVTD